MYLTEGQLASFKNMGFRGNTNQYGMISLTVNLKGTFYLTLRCIWTYYRNSSADNELTILPNYVKEYMNIC